MMEVPEVMTVVEKAGGVVQPKSFVFAQEKFENYAKPDKSAD